MLVWEPPDEPREVPDPPEIEPPDGGVIAWVFGALCVVFVVVLIAACLWGPR